MKKNLLFVCIENSNRSQMAQAFARLLGGDQLEAFSAGSKPSGRVNPKAIAAMAELGYDLSTHDSKSLQDIPDIEYDLVVTMGCGDECPFVRAKARADWALPDPRHLEGAAFLAVRDEIRLRMLAALQQLGIKTG
ncbi:MAG: arsenate reductase ArsC [Pedobacter sp.]|nr:arsenate reductase ArsC [Pedobacter sp.]